MEISEFRVVLRAKSFENTCRFWGEVMLLPRLKSWENGAGAGALFQAGTGVIEVRGRGKAEDSEVGDEAWEYSGPRHKLTLTLTVGSAEQAYEELIFRERNIPGGLKSEPDGSTVFETRDPDGVKVVFRERVEHGATIDMPTEGIEVQR